MQAWNTYCGPSNINLREKRHVEAYRTHRPDGTVIYALTTIIVSRAITPQLLVAK